jgi:hypothetical protein
MAPPDPPDAPPDAPSSADSPTADGSLAPEREPTVKDLLDPRMQADLERWFGLPSFQELADRGAVPPKAPVVEDPEVVARRALRDKALASVDPDLVESRYRRVASYETMLDFERTFELRVAMEVGVVDEGLIAAKLAEPREVEIPEPLREDLAECAPQAILRDLHRPEIYFDKVFEMVDHAAEQRVNVVEEVARAMRTDWRLPAPPRPPAEQMREDLAELRADRRRDISHLLPTFANRRVTES